MFKAIFFDLDGTLIDSKLDFDQMRLDLNLPHGAPVLEEVEKIENPDQKERSHAIIHQHELIGASESVLIEGVFELLDDFPLPTGILTRNSRVCTNLMLEKHGLKLEHVLTREDCTPKPDPAGLLHLSKIHQVDPSDCLYVGDFQFDILTAHNAGMKAALYQPKGELPFSHMADYTFSNYLEFRSRFFTS